MKAQAGMQMDWFAEMLTTTALCKLLRYLTLLEYLHPDVYYAYKDMVAGKGSATNLGLNILELYCIKPRLEWPN
jgi:hypothetical protein